MVGRGKEELEKKAMETIEGTGGKEGRTRYVGKRERVDDFVNRSERERKVEGE